MYGIFSEYIIHVRHKRHTLNHVYRQANDIISYQLYISISYLRFQFYKYEFLYHKNGKYLLQRYMTGIFSMLIIF